MGDTCCESGLIPRLKAHERTRRTSPNQHIWNSGARRHLVRQHEEKFENLPEDLHLTKACDDAGFLKEVSRGQFMCLGSDRPGGQAVHPRPKGHKG